MTRSSKGVGKRSRGVRAVACIGVALFLVACGGSKPTAPTNASALPLNTGDAPWPIPDRVGDRIAAAGLEGAPTESTDVHYHSHLDLFVDGKHQPVAASIGREGTSLFSPLHTHTTSGMIHIEAPTSMQVTLGQLFTEWGVRLTDSCAGGYCSPDTPVALYVNGKPSTTSPPDLVLKKGDEIALVIGTPPAAIPSSWDCIGGIDPTKENPAQCADFGEQV